MENEEITMEAGQEDTHSVKKDKKKHTALKYVIEGLIYLSLIHI